MDRRTSRARRLDRVAERLRPRSGWPLLVVAEDEDDRERQKAELERRYGPPPADYPIFVMTGVRRNRPEEPPAVARHGERDGDGP